MKIRVETYDGYRACERPLRFCLGEKRREVVEILDRWFGEDHDYFKVLADDGGVYVLRCNRGGDGWELTQYRAAEAGSIEAKTAEDGRRGVVN